MSLPAIARRPLPVAALVLVVGAAAAPAAAHEDPLPVAGRKLALHTDGSAAKRSFRFTSEKGYDDFTSGHDPRLGAALLVVGTGGGGHRGPLVPLDPSRWKPIGSESAPKGWKYRDRDATRGGVTRVTLKKGRISVQARGPSWAFAPDEAESELWVHLHVEDQWACALFGADGDVRKAAPGLFVARRAPSPAACPEPLCGNGAVEPGEACDDGDLDPANGCADDCTPSACAGEPFDSTFAAIQAVVFDAYGCTSGQCHGGGGAEGHASGLDLASGTAQGTLDANHAALLAAAPANDAYAQFLAPADADASLLYQALWKKLHCAALPAPAPCDALDAENVQAMPVGSALAVPELEAIELWIAGGAPKDAVVAGSAERLGVCLPPQDALPAGAGVRAP